MKENRRKDMDTAKASMKRSGDDVRLAGLKNKKRPDLKEKQVLERLEAKYLGLVFVAEVKRRRRKRPTSWRRCRSAPRPSRRRIARTDSRRN